ncbi:response regulator [Aurantimonas aggregata]|uniref:Response regulator n=1 Tax=Aurantimonas aggregata TaxID=2047720 RepID=A0A6L9ML65_9HYPH|nr:response regulator [Aurantimonas aggregata]NDV88589.1 response regulator [Aurantimonas aggregata]
MQTCLVVDDAPIVRKVVSRMLPQLGLVVDCVASPSDAKDWLEENGLPDLVLVAAAVLGNDAPDLVRQIKALPGGDRVIVLAVIVDGNLGLMTRLKRAGVAGFIYKPFDRASLRAAITPYLAAKATPWNSGSEPRPDQFRVAP